MRWLWLCVLAIVSGQVFSQDLTGRADVVDAQTLVINFQQVELYGVIAPKVDQPCFAGLDAWPCGEVAAATLNEWVAGTVVSCEPWPLSGGDEKHACSVGEDDLNARLLMHGWALASDSAEERYHLAEQAARRAKLGIFRDGFVPNNAWRLWASDGLDEAACGACALRKQSIKKRQQATQ